MIAIRKNRAVFSCQNLKSCSGHDFQRRFRHGTLAYCADVASHVGSIFQRFVQARAEPDQRTDHGRRVSDFPATSAEHRLYFGVDFVSGPQSLTGDFLNTLILFDPGGDLDHG